MKKAAEAKLPATTAKEEIVVEKGPQLPSFNSDERNQLQRQMENVSVDLDISVCHLP